MPRRTPTPPSAHLPTPPPGWQRPGLAALLAACFLASVPALRADGGTLRIANASVGAYRVSVFTDPTPVPPDAIDVSVLATLGREQTPAQDLYIEIVARRLDAVGAEVRHVATREEATDRRYYAANFALGSVGRWEIRLHIKGPEGEGDLAFQLRVQERGLFDSPFLLLGLALVPLVLVGLWLKLSSPSSHPGD